MCITSTFYSVICYSVYRKKIVFMLSECINQNDHTKDKRAIVSRPQVVQDKKTRPRKVQNRLFVGVGVWLGEESGVSSHKCLHWGLLHWSSKLLSIYDSPCHFQLEPHTQNVLPTLCWTLHGLRNKEIASFLVKCCPHFWPHSSLIFCLIALVFIPFNSTKTRFLYNMHYNGLQGGMAVLKGTKWRQDMTLNILLQLLHTLVLT